MRRDAVAAEGAAMTTYRDYIEQLIPAPPGLRALVARGHCAPSGHTVYLTEVPVLALGLATRQGEDGFDLPVRQIIGLTISDMAEWGESGDWFDAADFDCDFLCYLNPGEDITEDHIAQAIKRRRERIRRADMLATDAVIEVDVQLAKARR